MVWILTTDSTKSTVKEVKNRRRKELLKDH